jgi:hypothetical protein
MKVKNPSRRGRTIISPLPAASATYRRAANSSAATPITIGAPRVLPASSSTVYPASKNLLTAFISALRRVTAWNASLLTRVVHPWVVMSYPIPNTEEK